MRAWWALMGQALFWLTWPGIALIMPRTRRSRVLVVHEGKILLVKSWYGSGEWTLPGGGIKRGETPLQTAKRELSEETGLKPKNIKSLGQATQTHHGLTMHYYQFAAEQGGKSVRPKPPRLVISNCVWVSPARLPKNTQPHVRETYQAWRAKR